MVTTQNLRTRGGVACVSKRGARGRFLDASRVEGNETFIAYIDESGDEGFSFLPGCSEWFVLSAVLVRRTEDLKMVDLTKSVKHEFGKPIKRHYISGTWGTRSDFCYCARSRPLIYELLV
jgi:hypothetical protein